MPSFRLMLLLSIFFHSLILGAIALYARNTKTPVLRARSGISLNVSFASSIPNSITKTAKVAPASHSLHQAKKSARKMGSSGLRTNRSSNYDWNIRYPERALEMGKEGAVLLSCTLPAGSASCSNVRIVGSSGFRELDSAAQKGLLRYAGFPPANHPRRDTFRILFRIRN